MGVGGVGGRECHASSVSNKHAGRAAAGRPALARQQVHRAACARHPWPCCKQAPPACLHGTQRGRRLAVVRQHGWRQAQQRLLLPLRAAAAAACRCCCLRRELLPQRPAQRPRQRFRHGSVAHVVGVHLVIVEKLGGLLWRRPAQAAVPLCGVCHLGGGDLRPGRRAQPRHGVILWAPGERASSQGQQTRALTEAVWGCPAGRVAPFQGCSCASGG